MLALALLELSTEMPRGLPMWMVLVPILGTGALHVGIGPSLKTTVTNFHPRRTASCGTIFYILLRDGVYMIWI